MSKFAMVYESRKNIVETMTAVRDSTQPWKLSALWRTRGACFYKLRRNGVIRLYRTGDRLGFCWADLRMRPVRKGGTVVEVSTATTAGAGALAWILSIICILLALYDYETYGTALLRDLPYFLLCVAAASLAVMTIRETPKLLHFIEFDLGWDQVR